MASEESTVDKKGVPGEGTSYADQPPPLGFVAPGSAYGTTTDYAPPPYCADADPKPGEQVKMFSVLIQIVEAAW